MMIDVDYPTIVLSFTYRNFKLQLDQTDWQGNQVYSVWAHHAEGCAVAVPCAATRTEAVHRAKHWVDQRLVVGAIAHTS